MTDSSKTTVELTAIQLYKFGILAISLTAQGYTVKPMISTKAKVGEEEVKGAMIAEISDAEGQILGILAAEPEHPRFLMTYFLGGGATEEAVKKFEEVHDAIADGPMWPTETFHMVDLADLKKGD